jgi:hypothetical protein
LSNGIIAIIDPDADYALKLAEYFNLKSGLNYSVSVFTDYDSLMNYLSETYVDILLISEEFSSCMEQMKNTGNIFILTEGNVDSVLSEYTSLYKYQPSDCILRDVMSCCASYAASPQSMVSTASPANIIGIYSPVKRCGKTCFALAYGCITALSESCLYINLEEYSGFTCFTEDSSLGDLSDLLYFYRQNPSNLDKKLMALSRSYHNLNYIPPMQFSYDIKNMESEDLSGFVEAIAKTEHYRTIILDISDSVKDVPSLLNICSKIFMPTTRDSISQHKITDFFQSISAICNSSIKEKTEILSLPFADEHLFSVSNGNLTDSTDFMEKLIYSNLGTYIRNLMIQGVEGQ